MTFDEIKSFLHVNRFGITNPGTKKLSKILTELVDAIKAALSGTSSSVSELKTVYGFPEFVTTKAYVEKDLVVYSGKLYKCKAGGHSAGAWDATHFTETTLAAEVETIMKTPAPSAGGGEAS